MINLILQRNTRKVLPFGGKIKIEEPLKRWKELENNDWFCYRKYITSKLQRGDQINLTVQNHGNLPDSKHNSRHPWGFHISYIAPCYLFWTVVHSKSFNLSQIARMINAIGPRIIKFTSSIDYTMCYAIVHFVCVHLYACSQ